MIQNQQLRLRSFFAGAIVGCSLVNSVLAWDYGNGRHGNFVLTTNATIEQLYQTVRLTNDPAQYNPADSNAIPNFQNLVITNGATLTANPWDGSAGGRIVMKIQTNIVVTAGCAISATGIGYRGGLGSGQQGESYGGSQSSSANANLGGGGCGCGGCDGGGGGYGSVGVTACGTGGNIYGNEALDVVYLGSGGGSGYGGYPGGNGGGAIVINAQNIQILGLQQANGNQGSSYVTYGGGGGSGGSILLRMDSAFLGSNNITAIGGSTGQYGHGGAGGVGRIMLEYTKGYVGTVSPTPYIPPYVVTITNQPASQTNVLGANAVFEVGFSTASAFSVRWYFNGAAIPNATNQTLILTGLALTNQGNYSVVISNSTLSAISLNAVLTVLDNRDFDGDGIPNFWEQQYGLNPNNSNDATNHPPGEQLTWLQKYLYGLNSTATDYDGDGLSDYTELYVYHTNPLLADTDGDGIPDGWEVLHGLNPLVNDAGDDADFDGLSSLLEYQYDLSHTNQLNPRNGYSAGFNFPDFEIYNGGSHTNRIYYDRDDRLVGEEFSRGISVAYKYDGNGNLIRQTVLSRAGETNGLPVLWQFLNGLTNTTAANGPYGDPDGDGWSNYQEWKTGTDPNNPQSNSNTLGNPGTNIASLALPFTPSNFIMAAGELDGVIGDELVIGADGNPGGRTNSLVILTQNGIGWQTQHVDVGIFGITSIAIGQPTNRPSPAIYLGLRSTGGNGRIVELSHSSGFWLMPTNVVAMSTNEAAFVLGVRGKNDLLASFATNGMDGTLFGMTYSNNAWTQTILSTNTSNLGLGTHGTVWSRILRDASFRLLDTGDIEAIGGSMELSNGITPILNPTTGKWHFQTLTPTNWNGARDFFHSFGGSLVTINSEAENTWINDSFPTVGKWIGFYRDAGAVFRWNSGAPVVYTSCYSYGGGLPPTFAFYSSVPCWYAADPATVNLDAVGELLTFDYVISNKWSIHEQSAINRLVWRGLTLDSGFPRTNQTNSSSFFHAFVDDKNMTASINAGDDFVVFEYAISGNIVTTSTLVRVPITASTVAQSYSLASVNFLPFKPEVLFTAEPDGQIFFWQATNATGPLQRQLFSSDHQGKAWHALAGVKLSEPGEGLVGLRINPTNQSRCDVIFWSPQAQLPQIVSVPQTAPSAAVIPSANPLGNVAIVNIRLWDNEGNASTPFLQYQLSSSTNWQNATLTALDGAAYNPATRVATLPTGANHTLAWNAMSDLGAGIVTNILLRARAQDFSLVGDWSSPTPFTVNMTQDSNTNGIPDWWETQYFGSLQPANGDYDNDGFSNYAEYNADTNPNDQNSNLRMMSVAPTLGGVTILWQGGNLSTQYLQQRLGLNISNGWTDIFTNIPPTPNPSSFTNSAGTNISKFYRVRVTR